MNCKIRPMLKTDRRQVIGILDTTPEFSGEEKTVAVELIDLYLGKNSTSGYIIDVAQIDFSVGGYICYGPTPLTASSWDIYWIAVTAEKQRLGLGRALLEHAEAVIASEHGTMILIETSSKPEYSRTRHFYESSEYRVIASIPDFYAENDDKIIFQKILAADVLR